METFSVRKTTAQFIAEASIIHGSQYDYSKVDYKNNKEKVCIICPIHGEFWQRPQDHIQRKTGCPRCSKFKFVKGERHKHIYRLWQGIIKRCNPKSWETIRYASYKGCIICDEWKSFDNFFKWFNDPKNGYKDGYQIDKDILVKGNREYSPDKCCFVPSEINNLLTKCNKSRGKYPVGVSKNRNTFAAYISKNSKQICVGTFKTPQEAFHAYKDAKEQYIKERAEKYFQEGKITDKVYNALMRYEVEITD